MFGEDLIETIKEEDDDRYHAFVLLNALEMFTLDGSVRRFLKNDEDDVSKRTVLVTTTSHEDWNYFHEKPVEHGVDAITAASKQANVEPVAQEIVGKVEEILGH